MSLLDILLPETASAPRRARRRYLVRTAFLLPGFVLFFLAPTAMSSGVMTVLFQVMSLILCVGLIYEFIALMRTLDELQNRIHMTALAISGGAVASLATLLGIAGLTFGGPEPTIALALPAMGAGYYVALFFVSRRYQ